MAESESVLEEIQNTTDKYQQIAYLSAKIFFTL